MGKQNPAWNAFNEACRAADAAYEKEAEPIRNTLFDDLLKTEKRFQDKIVPLQVEKNNALQSLKEEARLKMRKLSEKRDKAINAARIVRNEELKAKEAVPA